MWKSPKRYIKQTDGKIVEAGPGVSGTLVIAEGGELTEAEAQAHGLLGATPGQQTPEKPWEPNKETEAPAPALPVNTVSSVMDTSAMPHQTIGSANVAK